VKTIMQPIRAIMPSCFPSFSVFCLRGDSSSSIDCINWAMLPNSVFIPVAVMIACPLPYDAWVPM